MTFSDTFPRAIEKRKYSDLPSLLKTKVLRLQESELESF